jgi:hypothetical protein
MALEIKGVFYQALKNVFPDVVGVVEPELGKHFERDIDPDAWYDAEPYAKTLAYLVARISPEAAAFLGNEFVELMTERFGEMKIGSVDDFVARVSALYHEYIRGGEGEGWEVEEFRPGRMVIKETGFLPFVDFIAGVIKRAVEALGGLNVRVTVLEDRARSAEARRYLAEWLDADQG